MLPLNNFMRVSVALMIVHQFVAFALYVTPLIFMFERLWGSHNARWFIRMPLRLPVGACHALSPAEFLERLHMSNHGASMLQQMQCLPCRSCSCKSGGEASAMRASTSGCPVPPSISRLVVEGMQKRTLTFNVLPLSLLHGMIL